MIVIGPASILRPAGNTTPCSALIESSNRSSSLFPSTGMQGCQRPSIQAGQRGGGGEGGSSLTLLSIEAEGNTPSRDTSRIRLTEELHVALTL